MMLYKALHSGECTLCASLHHRSTPLMCIEYLKQGHLLSMSRQLQNLYAGQIQFFKSLESAGLCYQVQCGRD